MYQRSADVFLGLPFNIASYSLLTHLIATVIGKKAGTLSISLGCVHIYAEHYRAVEEQLSRTPYDLPMIEISPLTEEELLGGCVSQDMIKIKGYIHGPPIRATMKA
jgi:thymidylate synthase